MRFPLRNRKYADQINLNDYNLRMKGDKLIADRDVVTLIARASGLKSKKTRKINKRFKHVIMDSIRDAINDDNFTNSFASKSTESSN